MKTEFRASVKAHLTAMHTTGLQGRSFSRMEEVKKVVNRAYCWDTEPAFKASVRAIEKQIG